MAHSPHSDMYRISFTHIHMASTWVVAFHSPFLYSDLPPPSPSFRLAQAIFEPNFFPYKYPNILNPSFSSYLPAYEDGTDSFQKRWHIKFRRQGITQQKAYNIQNTAKVWSQELWDVCGRLSFFLYIPVVRTWCIVFVPHFKQWRLPRGRILYRNIILPDKCH